jgi:peptidoglycan hydrolase CwlO-like protein
MLHEEFEQLSGLTVSQDFYQTVIEAAYMAQSNWESKEAFVTLWMKQNKGLITKAIRTDISGLSNKVCILQGIKAQAERAGAERDEAKEQLERTKSMLEQVSHQNDEYYNRKVEAQERAKEYSKFEPELAAAKETIAARDAEIQRLKAMLFDALYASKAA